VKETMQDSYSHPGVEGIADAEIEQIIHGPGYREWKEDEVQEQQY
jgi:hypothetical protein